MCIEASTRSCLIVTLLSGCYIVPALAQQQGADLRLFRNPAEMQPVTPQKAPGQSLLVLKPPSALAPQQDVTYDSNVKYTDTKITNPYFGGEDMVHLRSYNGSLVAPAIALYPSQSVRIRLHNQLPVEDLADCPRPEGRAHTVLRRDRIPVTFALYQRGFAIAEFGAAIVLARASGRPCGVDQIFLSELNGDLP